MALRRWKGLARGLAASVSSLAIALLVAAPSAGASGASLVRDIYPGGSGSAIGAVTDVGGTLFFTADDGIHGNELWKAVP